MLSNDTLTTAIAALYALRASNETWIGGNQVERVDAAIAELEATAPKGRPAQTPLAAPDAMLLAWTPIDGYIFVTVGGQLQVVKADSIGGIKLPEDYAVCKRVDAPQADAKEVDDEG